MGIFNKIRRILRGGKALPNEHGPMFIKRDDMGRWVMEDKQEAKCPVDHTKITTVKATANDNPACVCGQGDKCYCKAGDEKKTYAKSVTSKIEAASATKPARKPKLQQVIEDAEAMKAKGIVQKPAVIDGINKKVAENKKAKAKAKATEKKPVAKTTAKKDAIKKDIADTPVAKKKKPAPKKK